MERDTQTIIKENLLHVREGVLLLDHYDEFADMLRRSFRSAGFQGPVISVADNGFLPEDVISLYRWYCEEESTRPLPGAVKAGEEPDEEQKLQYRSTHAGFRVGRARFFNQIELPDYWEISGSASSGEIHDLQHLRGRIFYSGPAGKRLVSDVDWLDEKGVVRCTDHYDCRGVLYGRTVFNRRGERFCRSWFDGRGGERIVENFVTNAIIVNRSSGVKLFKSRTELAVNMLRQIGADGSRIFYNSLSVPLFVSERMKKPEGGHVLFWQEGPREDVPGNMQMILSGASKTTAICVQNRESYRKLAEHGASKEVIRPFGFVYDYARENSGNADALICTNSDQIQDLQILVESLPEITFHIAAVTEMSSRLLSYGRYPNVRLYPTVKKDMAEELFNRCDLYLDINHGGEILSSVKRAFLHNQVILGYRRLLHNSRYVGEDCVFEETDGLCNMLRQILLSSEKRTQCLGRQREQAVSEQAEAYKRLLDMM